ncbi:MAG: aromatic ring-hydroxylating dioxygenase subunit alpha [Hyphomonadaceae bacterium]
MFEGFANNWTPVIELREIGSGPLRLEIAGEGIVFFRGDGGRIGALVDRCPHRGVRLSLGQVGKDGCLECPFHGWRFAPDGANRHVPLNPDAKLDMLAATSLPVRVMGDMVWIYTAPGREAPTEPIAPEGLVEPGLARTYVTRLWNCHWTRAMENMLDSPHLPFVHRKTIGKSLLRRMTPKSSMDIVWEEAPWGGRASARLDGVDGGGVLEYFRPNMMALTIPIPKRHFRIHALVVPAGERQTRLTVVASRDFLRSGMFSPMFRSSSAKIADEDKAVVESSPSGEVPPAAQERSVRTDKATLQFRKYYHDALKGSSAPSLAGKARQPEDTLS